MPADGRADHERKFCFSMDCSGCSRVSPATRASPCCCPDRDSPHLATSQNVLTLVTNSSHPSSFVAASRISSGVPSGARPFATRNCADVVCVRVQARPEKEDRPVFKKILIPVDLTDMHQPAL